MVKYSSKEVQEFKENRKNRKPCENNQKKQEKPENAGNQNQNQIFGETIRGIFGGNFMWIIQISNRLKILMV